MQDIIFFILHIPIKNLINDKMFSHDFTDVTLVQIDNIDSHAHMIILTSDSPKK